MIFFSKLIVLLWLCCNSLACIKPLQPQKHPSNAQSNSHQRLGFRFERIPEGVLVVYVAENMGAEISGLQAGDIVFTANGASGEKLISVLQDRSQDYVHLEIQPRWSNERKTLVVQRGIGSGIESPAVQPLLKFAATGDLTEAKALWKEGSYQSEDVVTALRLVSRNYPSQYPMWLDAVRDLVPLNTRIVASLMGGYNDQEQFARSIEVHDAWMKDVGWDLWTGKGAVYTHTNLGVEKELLRALMQSGNQERARERVRTLQRWYADIGLESLVGIEPLKNTTIVWSDKKPTFANVSGVDVQGNPWSIEDTPWTVLAFWATWCAPCKKEIPELNQWSLSRSDVNVLAVNVDDDLSSAGVSKALRKLDATHVQGIRSPSLLEQVGVEAIPTLVLLDSNGTERYRMIGYSPETIVEIESKMTTVASRVKLANARNLTVEWYPKLTLIDVLYDGEQWWLLDENKLKQVETLTGWLTGTEIETVVETPHVSENNPAERLVQMGDEIGTIHNSGRVLRFTTDSEPLVLSFGEAIVGWYVSEAHFWVWGENTIEFIDLEQELQGKILWKNPLPNLPVQHSDGFPLYEDNTLTKFTSTETVPSREDTLRWNSSAFNATTLFGHDVSALENAGSIQWQLRRHSMPQNRWRYSLVALDDANIPLATLSTMTHQNLKLVSGYTPPDTSIESGPSVEDGKGMWLVIPNQGLLHVEIANRQPPELNRR